MEIKAGYILSTTSIWIDDVLIPIDVEDLNLCDFEATKRLYPPLLCPIQPSTRVQRGTVNLLVVLKDTYIGIPHVSV